jgi:hypothetical protein
VLHRHGLVKMPGRARRWPLERRYQ